MTDKRERILVIDDDVNVVRIVELYFEREGYEVASCARGDTALEAFRMCEPKLVLLDIMLPGRDGYDVLRDIRELSAVPVIMLTAKGDTDDRVDGLDLGADDYVAKPFDAKELVARARAVLRRAYYDSGVYKTALTYGNLSISIDSYEVELNGERVKMPPKELELLYCLASNAGRVFTREQLLEQVWGFDFFGDTRTVDVHIKRIREKLADRQGWDIITRHTVGYMFTADGMQ
ncbi:MAG: response regulator transcription factor [Clostridia bacterium]|nr:response regulator transcription factor [Clostridia bacterium]